ncbi:hypothetical protein FOZ63_015370 [Perkinsus olseni]|uniref:Uncharacterized protein n=1 Tax=Perkinsus olseni TaxID=32597 RepID=A0A7J6PV30_PEROL|nr:hypothetical protein FOZ62_023040 [Perkinsus olseni]KAF4699872.1 hypothetical protein FOZ63_015370 [Perkinsus olseni]
MRCGGSDQKEGVIVSFSHCNVTSDGPHTTASRSCLFMKSPSTSAASSIGGDIQVCLVVVGQGTTKSECFTGRIADFNIVNGHTWAELREHLAALPAGTRDINLTITHLGDSVKLANLSISGWVDYVHLYDASPMEASPYLIFFLQHRVPEEETEAAITEDTNQCDNKMEVLRIGAFELAREKIRKRKQLECILRIGEERLEQQEEKQDDGDVAVRGGGEANESGPVASSSNMNASKKRRRAAAGRGASRRRAHKGLSYGADDGDLIIMLSFCAGCFDRSPTAAPPRASEIITPAATRRDQPEMVVVSRNVEEKQPGASRLVTLSKATIPSSTIQQKRSVGDGHSPTTTSEFPYLFVAPVCFSEVSVQQFPYVYGTAADSHDGVKVSGEKFPYLPSPPCEGVVTTAAFPYLYHRVEEPQKVSPAAFPYLYPSSAPRVASNRNAWARSFPYPYNADGGTHAAIVSVAAFPYVYINADPPRPFTEAQKSRNRRSFRGSTRKKRWMPM